jgi:hypothetical protein
VKKIKSKKKERIDGQRLAGPAKGTEARRKVSTKTKGKEQERERPG